MSSNRILATLNCCNKILQQLASGHSQTAINPSVQRIAALGDSMTYEGGGSYAFGSAPHALESHDISTDFC